MMCFLKNKKIVFLLGKKKQEEREITHIFYYESGYQGCLAIDIIEITQNYERLIFKF